MSLLPKLFPNIHPILEKAKEKVKSSFLTTTNTVIGILVGISTLIVYGLDIKGKLNNTDAEVLKKDSIEIINKKTKTNTLKDGKSYSSMPLEEKSKKIVAPKKINYFNNKEFLLEDSNIAIFIKSANGNIDSEFQNKLSNTFQTKNIPTSISFFTSQSLPHFSNFYTANPSWLKTINIKAHANKYLVGNIRANKSSSSEDSDITIVNITFQGKIVNTKTNQSLPITKQIRETNYQEFKAFDDAYNRLCENIVDATLNF